MSPDSWPVKPMLANVLKLKWIVNLNSKIAEQSTSVKRKNTMGTYIDVTRELVHRIPSQPLPRGSIPTQLGGVFFQLSLRDFKAVTTS